MMNVFSTAVDSIEDLEQWGQHKHREKTSRILGDGAKSMPYSMLINELFDPQDNENKETYMFMNEIATRLSEVFLK